MRSANHHTRSTCAPNESGVKDSISRLVASLRSHRGLSQSELARFSGLSLPTVQKVEGGGNMRGQTLAMLYRGLNAAGLLTDQEAELFRSLSGLHALPPPREATDPRRSTPEALSLRDFTSTLDRDTARCYWLLSDMLHAQGATRVFALLSAAAPMAGVSIEPTDPGQPEPRVFTRIDPPKRRPDGSIEVVHTEYEVREDAPPASEKTRRKNA